MKISPKFLWHALALLFVFTSGIATAQAQQKPEAKTVSPPSPAPQIAQPPQTLPAKPVADKLAPAGWKRYEVGEPARFSLILPGEPVASVDRVKIVPGVVETTRTYLSVSDSGVYGISYLDVLPAALREEEGKRTFFAGFFKEFAEGFQARMKAGGQDVRLTMLEHRAATAGGLAGYEQEFSHGTMMGRVRLVFDAGSAYAVAAVWNGLSSNSERNAFFESLRVNPKR